MLRAPEIAQSPYDPSVEAVAGQALTEPLLFGSGEPDDCLDATLVKHAVTVLHQEEERQFSAYAEYTEARIAEIVADHALFLKNQRTTATQSLKTNRRKSLFETMTEAYFTQSMGRARELQARKAREFRAQTIEAQNAEFLNRALLPETILDDQIQTAYRNMILFNLETLYKDAPAEERRQALDRAAEVVYRKIIEKRLEIAQAAVKPLLDAPAVCRVLGDAAVQAYRDRAAAIEKDTALRREAAGFVDREADRKEAEEWARHKHPGDRDAFLGHYRELRYQYNRKHCFTHILNFDAVWRELKAHDFNPGALPAWVANTDPALHTAVLANLAEREKNGGMPPEPDYQALLEFAAGYDPHAAFKKLADKDALHSLVSALGGPDSGAFQVCLRMLLGKGTEADQAWLRDLRLAREEFASRIPGDAATPPQFQDYLSRFDTARRVRLARAGHGELDEPEARALASSLEIRQPEE